ncbi:unnamed protein product [Phyllotreta striolata]|uniref:Acyl-coenzyme A oxidase n=1 Tax=Phyllotreta striolata TaxID=444603 RepID=A0A9N9TTI3_PHYSR|nr:unnamed protein product [Phyllotreta striolata]
MDLENGQIVFRNLPVGPLTPYRNRAKCDWRKLKLIFEDEDLLKVKLFVWKTLEKDPLFHRSIVESTTDEKKRLAAVRLRRYIDYKFVPGELQMPYRKRTKLFMAYNEALACTYPDVSVKHALGVGLFSNTIITLGTEKHRKYAYVADKMLSCLALTEIAHGSDTKQMRTTATYDRNTKEFVINTPDFEAAKCWVGNLGKQCTHALLFAQLYTKGECHGLHAFVVPIRDPATLQPYPGILVGDMGEKIGLHGIDNGFVMFDRYRIPKDNLLNRTADVTPDGDYESSFTEPGRILGAALENLSMGRVGIMQECSNNLVCAVTIAVRYAFVRRQFSPKGEGGGDSAELAIIEYPLHQWRLFPHMAAAAVLRIFVNGFTETYLTVIEKSASSIELENLSHMVSEIHALVSAAKPLMSFSARDAAQECREACGGHGFLKAARLGEIRSTVEPCLTYEGDNNVLAQQTSNWLLRQWRAPEGQLSSPLGSCGFFLRRREIRGRRRAVGSVREAQSQDFIMDAYEWLILNLVEETDKKMTEIMESGSSKFTARNESQVYRASVLTRAYGEYTALRYYWLKVVNAEDTLKPTLVDLGVLYGLSCLDKHLIYFYQGGYAVDAQFARNIKEAVLESCKKLKIEALAVIDGMAPTDFVVHSVLGASDGKVYENLEKLLLASPEATTRPSWWKEIVYGTSALTNLPSKL